MLWWRIKLGAAVSGDLLPTLRGRKGEALTYPANIFFTPAAGLKVQMVTPCACGMKMLLRRYHLLGNGLYQSYEKLGWYRLFPTWAVLIFAQDFFG